MRVRSTLLQKGMVSASLVLILELLFIGSLAYMLNEAGAQIDEDNKVRAVISHLTRASNLIQNISIAMVTATILQRAQPQRSQSLPVFSDELKKELQSVKTLVQDRPDELHALERLEQTCNQGIPLLEKARATYFDSEVAHFQYLLRLRRISNTATQQSDDIVQHYKVIEEAGLARLAKSRQIMKQWLLLGMVLNVVLVFSLALLFIRGITKRVETLMDNTLRLAAGEKLRPAQKGNDEIAKLDLFFHSMAESLEEAANKERAIVDNAADIICSIDEHGVFTTLNPASTKVWDYAPEELLGSRLIGIVVPEDTSKTAQNLKQVATEGTELSFENRIKRKDGGVVHMLWSAHWVAKEKSLFCVAHDITQRKVVEELKKEFVAMVSHDLRTPLTSILSSLELIATGSFGALSSPGQKIVEDSESELNRLIQLINDLLDIARMEAGKWQFNLAPNIVTDIIERSLRAVAGVSKHRGIAVVVPETELEVVADSERIVQVMVNLLSNAIKFSPAGSEVRVSVKKIDDDWVEIRVSDAGPGIPVEFRDSIFQRFEQLTPETSLNNSADRVGSGLGLAICKTIIEGHGGTLGVDGSEHGGSSFYFRIRGV